MKQSERFNDLMNKYLAGNASLPERDELFLMISSDDTAYQGLLDGHVTATLQNETIEGPSLTGSQKQEILTNIFGSDTVVAPVIEMPVRKRFVKTWTAAAAILVLAVAGTYVWMQPGSQQEQVAKKGDSFLQPGAVAGTSDKTTLTLDDGGTINLDKSTEGFLSQQGNTLISKTNGRLLYSHEQEDGSSEAMYNTITTLGASQFQVELPDGSLVWLNTHSSLRFPVVFAGNERKVEVTGQAYFEVAKDAHKKFIVSGKGINTEVLGTHFDVCLYDNDEDKRVTLLEGSIRVSNGQGNRLLKPGQQARVKAGTMAVVNADAAGAVAWKEGYFIAGSASAVLNQVARWYDVDLKYNGPVPQKQFNGKIARSSLADVVKILETNDIHVALDEAGKRLIVR
jgi:ferric-dicitrate binding protein FerR (iron transport regulator)